MKTFAILLPFMMTFCIINMVKMKAPTKFTDENYFKRTNAIIWQTLKDSGVAGIAVGMAMAFGPKLALLLGA